MVSSFYPSNHQKQSFIGTSYRRVINYITKTFSSFWQQYPLLLLSIYYLLGISCHILNWAIIAILFSIFSPPDKNKYFCISIFILGIIISKDYFPQPLTKEYSGTATINFSSISKSIKKPFQIKYKGSITNFSFDDKTKKSIRHISFTYYFPKNKKIDGDYTYQVHGRLIPTIFNSIRFKPDKTDWLTIKRNSYFNEKRFFWKNFIKNLWRKKCLDKDVLYLLTALSTGEVDDNFLSFSFSRVGLNHILAISGFHFGMVLFFFSILLKKIIRSIYLPICLLCLVNLYFLYIGPSPSIIRTYLMIQLALFSQLINKRNIALNALGFASIIQLTINPSIIFHIGFQLSYLCCMSIFLIYPLVSKSTSSKKLSQKIYFFFKEAFLLTMSINLFISPILLYYFHKIPVLSIFYNLIIPLLITFIVFLMIISLFVHVTIFFFSPIVDKTIFFISKITLFLIYNPPNFFEFFFRANFFSSAFVIIYLSFIFILSIFFHEKKKQKNLIFSQYL